MQGPSGQLWWKQGRKAKGGAHCSTRSLSRATSGSSSGGSILTLAPVSSRACLMKTPPLAPPTQRRLQRQHLTPSPGAPEGMQQARGGGDTHLPMMQPAWLWGTSRRSCVLGLATSEGSALAGAVCSASISFWCSARTALCDTPPGAGGRFRGPQAAADTHDDLSPSVPGRELAGVERAVGWR